MFNFKHHQNDNWHHQRGPSRKRPLIETEGSCALLRNEYGNGSQQNSPLPRGPYNRRNYGYGSSHSPSRFHDENFPTMDYGLSQRPHSSERVGVQGYAREGRHFDTRHEFITGHGLSPSRSNQDVAQGNYGGSFQRSSPGYSESQRGRRNYVDTGQRNLHNCDSPHGPVQKFNDDGYTPNRSYFSKKGPSPSYDYCKLSDGGVDFDSRGGNGYEHDLSYSSHRPLSPCKQGFFGGGGYMEGMRPTDLGGHHASSASSSRYGDERYKREHACTSQRAPGDRDDKRLEHSSGSQGEITSRKGFHGYNSSYNSNQVYQLNYGHSSQRVQSLGLVRGREKHDNVGNIVSDDSHDNDYSILDQFSKRLTPERGHGSDYWKGEDPSYTHRENTQNLSEAVNVDYSFLNNLCRALLDSDAFGEGESVAKPRNTVPVLAVVHAEEPTKRLSTQQANVLLGAISRSLNCLPSLSPRFEDTRVNRGVVYIKCLNPHLKEWLIEKVPHMKVPGFPEINLRAMDARDVYIARESSYVHTQGGKLLDFRLPTDLVMSSNPDEVVSILNSQNEGLDTSQWQLVTSKEHVKGVDYTFMIGAKSVYWLKKYGLQVLFKVRMISVRLRKLRKSLR